MRRCTNRAVVQRDSQIVKSDTDRRTAGRRRQGVRAIGGRNVFVHAGPGARSSRTGRRTTTSQRRGASPARRADVDRGRGADAVQITGERYVAVAVGDSLRSAQRLNYYFRDGIVTACDDSIPDYYFKAKEIKRTGNFVVARPAVLYIGDVPVMWLPFVFQDVRGGRHSGILPPNVGVSDIVRNSPSYRRQRGGAGLLLGDQRLPRRAGVRSTGAARPGEDGARRSSADFRYNGEFRYRWLERYVTRATSRASQTTQGD